tara:strand:+ start:2467 stop:3144 length:678 start_codon:yes stop_codon:yes gene_type:complete
MPLEDTEGFTKLAMGGQQHQGAQDNSVFAEFYLHPSEDKEKSAEEGRPIFSDKEYIRIMVPGDKTTLVQRPVRLGMFPKNDNHRFGTQYAAFKEGNGQNLSGTPLAEWAMISRSQVKELEHFNCRTVEQLASMPDTAVQNFTGVSNLRTLAKRYLEDAKEGSAMTKMQAELDERDNRLDSMEAAMAEMRAELLGNKASKKVVAEFTEQPVANITEKPEKTRRRAE